jgi:hypothetical protein
MDRSHAPDPTPWQFEPTPLMPAHCASEIHDDDYKPPTTVEDRIAIAAIWFAAGWFTGWLFGLFF